MNALSILFYKNNGDENELGQGDDILSFNVRSVKYNLNWQLFTS